MNIHLLSKHHSVINQYISQIRDKSLQTDAMRFRKNLERIGQLIAYEVSKTLIYRKKVINTPLGKADALTIATPIVICSILRAGLPLHQGILNIFDGAESAFISAKRIHKKGSEDIEIESNYTACPDLNGKILIVADTMIATGNSLVACLEHLKAYGSPKSLNIVSAIGSLEGVELLNEQLPKDAHLWIADIDPTLNAQKYIVPGLGDAGDLAFGEKL
jgi:uracil phosphoribosyltransferase